MVTSDSLAGQSVQGGGSFGANSDSRGPSSQPSSSTTTNTTDTTDTSGASVLNPASSAADRQTSNSDVAPSGGGSGAGSGPLYNTAAGGVSTGGSAAGTAPNYVNNPAPSLGDNFKPHGKNITEGGIPADAPNASFNSEIGSKDDPSRVALGGMQEADVPSAGVPGDRRNQVTNDGQYDALKETSA